MFIQPAQPTPQPAPEVAPKPPAIKPTAPQQPDTDTRPPRPTLQKQDSTARASGNHSSTNLMNQTIHTIMERQKEFRAAAVDAKRAGEIETAKEYLKIYKGLDNLLKVAQGGLPVDLNTVCVKRTATNNVQKIK